MASAIIHICVMKKVNEVLKRDERKLFLGTIAPDISKQIGESKKKSHFLTDDRGTDMPNLDLFLSKYEDSLKDNDFNLGYYCHLYADMLWFGMFFKNYVSDDNTEMHYRNGEVVVKDPAVITKLLYNDYTNLNVTLIDKYDLDLSLFYDEAPKIESELDEIPLDKLQIIIDKMGIIIENSKARETVALDVTDICRFIDETAKDFINDLKEKGVI